MTKHVLTLYITGHTPRSARAVANLRRLYEKELREEFELTIVDVLEHPERAERDRILATPTLIRRSPPPILRIVGDLSDFDRVLSGLDIILESEDSQ